MSSADFAPQTTEFMPTAGDQRLDRIADSLQSQGDELDASIHEDYADTRLLDGLSEYCARTGDNMAEYFRHSSRFAQLARQTRHTDLFARSQPVHIPESNDNLHHNGQARRAESGYRMDMDYIRANGVDPGHVLYFRVTQPSAGTPKPEYYWTTDLMEVTKELQAELGPEQSAHAIVLVSTLAEIAQNGGLMNDVNDDNGIAVRQIGLAPFDQQHSMFSFKREDWS